MSGSRTAFFTPPLVTKTMVAQALKAGGFGDGDWEDDPVQEIRAAQVDARAVLHLSRKRPGTLLSDEAVQAQLGLLVQRLEYVVELLAGETVEVAKAKAATATQMMLFRDSGEPA